MVAVASPRRTTGDPTRSSTRGELARERLEAWKGDAVRREKLLEAGVTPRELRQRLAAFTAIARLVGPQGRHLWSCAAAFSIASIVYWAWFVRRKERAFVATLGEIAGLLDVGESSAWRACEELERTGWIERLHHHEQLRLDNGSVLHAMSVCLYVPGALMKLADGGKIHVGWREVAASAHSSKREGDPEKGPPDPGKGVEVSSPEGDDGCSLEEAPGGADDARAALSAHVAVKPSRRLLARVSRAWAAVAAAGGTTATEGRIYVDHPVAPKHRRTMNRMGYAVELRRVAAARRAAPVERRPSAHRVYVPAPADAELAATHGPACFCALCFERRTE